MKLEQKYEILTIKINTLMDKEKELCYLTLRENGHLDEILATRSQRHDLEDERQAVIRKINKSIIRRITKVVHR